MRGEDQLVYVKHDDGLTSGDYCGGTIVEGGEQTAYEVTHGGEPRQIKIGAVEATSRNKDAACSQTGALPDGDYTDGCVDPNTFQGFREVSSTPKEDDRSDILKDAQEAQVEDNGNEQTPEDTPDDPIEFTDISAELTHAHAPIPPVVEWTRTVTNNRNESVEISYDFVVEHPETTIRYERTREIEAGDSETVRGVKMSLDKWEENTNIDSRDERAEKYRKLFEQSSIYVEYNGKTWGAEKGIDERTSYP